jgi:hypothetical protein
MSLPSRIFRRIFLICVLVCGLSARAAEAGESQSQIVTVGGHAAPVCSLSALQATQASNITLDGGAINRAALNVPSLHDAKTAQLRPASISLVFEMICNGAHSIHIATAKGGLHTASELPERGGICESRSLQSPCALGCNLHNAANVRSGRGVNSESGKPWRVSRHRLSKPHHRWSWGWASSTSKRNL